MLMSTGACLLLGEGVWLGLGLGVGVVVGIVVGVAGETAAVYYCKSAGDTANTDTNNTNNNNRGATTKQN